MKICSVCQCCYEDAAIFCLQENHENLVAARIGTRKIAGKYRLDVLLERNAAGEIYQAAGVGVDQSFIIRLIPLNLFGHAQQLHERLSNVQAAQTLAHPNVISVLDHGISDDNEFYIVTEMIVGQTLQERLNNADSLSEATAIMIARQMAEGLEAAHAAGVIHRSINPSNIILLPNDANSPLIKIQNFDYGGILQQIVTTNIAAAAKYLDVLRYLSPEQCARNAVDARADIYSLGVVFYEMLSGESPFDAATPEEVVDKQINEQLLPLKHLRFDLKALLTHTLMRSLNKNPAARPQTAVGLARQLRHLEYITKKSSQISSQPATNLLPTIKPENTGQNLSTNDVADKSFPRENQLSPTPTVETELAANIIELPLSKEVVEKNILVEAVSILAEPIRVQKKISAVKFSPEAILVKRKGVRAFSFGAEPILVKRKKDKNFVVAATQPLALSPVNNFQSEIAEPAMPVAVKAFEINQTPAQTLPTKKKFSLIGIGLVTVLTVSAIFGAILFNRQIRQSAQAKESIAPTASAPASAPEEQLAPTMAADSDLPKPTAASAHDAKPPTTTLERTDKNQSREEILTNNTKAKQIVFPTENSEARQSSSATTNIAANNQNQLRETTTDNGSQAELNASLKQFITATNARDLDQQMNYYAPKVNAYYLARNASLETVRAEKKRVFANAEVKIQAGEPEIALSNNGQTAKMRFRKKYVIKKGEQNRSGEVIQELQWVKSGKDWKIVSERDVKVINR